MQGLTLSDFFHLPCRASDQNFYLPGPKFHLPETYREQLNTPVILGTLQLFIIQNGIKHIHKSIKQYKMVQSPFTSQSNNTKWYKTHSQVNQTIQTGKKHIQKSINQTIQGRKKL